MSILQTEKRYLPTVVITRPDQYGYEDTRARFLRVVCAEHTKGKAYRSRSAWLAVARGRKTEMHTLPNDTDKQSSLCLINNERLSRNENARSWRLEAFGGGNDSFLFFFFFPFFFFYMNDDFNV